MQNASSVKSSATRMPGVGTYTPTVRLTAHRGWYRVQSGTNPSVWYDTSANTCTCPARKPCKHQRFVRSLNVAFFVRKEVAPPAAVVTRLDELGIAAEARLAHARRALADTDPCDDSYAVLWCQVDGLEQEVAALHYQAMRAA